MKRVLFYLSCMMVLAFVVSSCQTGYSKTSYISSFERFVNKVDENWKTYDKEDWAEADERMEAFEEKCKQYEDGFTKEEKKTVSKLKTKYKTLRVKGGAKGFFDDVTEIYEEGKGVVEGLYEGIGGSGDTEQDR